MERARPQINGPSLTLSGLVLALSFARAATFYQGLNSRQNSFLNLSFRTISTRTIAIMWWFFTLIMMSSYTANLAGKYLSFARQRITLRGTDLSLCESFCSIFGPLEDSYFKVVSAALSCYSPYNTLISTIFSLPDIIQDGFTDQLGRGSCQADEDKVRNLLLRLD